MSYSRPVGKDREPKKHKNLTKGLNSADKSMLVFLGDESLMYDSQFITMYSEVPIVTSDCKGGDYVIGINCAKTLYNEDGHLVVLESKGTTHS
jgi:hypothetical protein